jgi:hypothetical protein
MVIIITPVPIDPFLPIPSPNKDVATLPRKHPTSYIATMRPVMVGLGESKLSLKAVALTRPVGSQLGCGYSHNLQSRDLVPPSNPLSYPIKRKPRHVSVVTAK